MQGIIQVYDPATGIGVALREEDHARVYLRPGSLRGSIFRRLRQGQRINFEVEEEGDRLYAHTVRIGSDGY